MLDYIIVFTAVAVLDFLWASYVVHTASKNAMKSALYAMFMYLLGPLVVLTYIENRWTLIAAALGAFVGTYYTVKRS